MTTEDSSGVRDKRTEILLEKVSLDLNETYLESQITKIQYCIQIRVNKADHFLKQTIHISDSNIALEITAD